MCQKPNIFIGKLVCDGVTINKKFACDKFAIDNDSAIAVRLNVDVLILTATFNLEQWEQKMWFLRLL